MIEELNGIGDHALREVESASSLDSLEKIRISVLGKKGALSQVLRGLGKVSAEERPRIGARANEWKKKIETALAQKKENLEASFLEKEIQNEKIDVTAPSRKTHLGSLHPLTQTSRKIIQTLGRLGFDVTIGPEADTEFLNFDAINIRKDHPARDMQDTFFLGPEVVLRTHTSSVQMRAMRQRGWPIRVLCPGAVYRCDNDATHSPMFHQIEGLWVDQGVRMSDLKGVLDFFAREIFGEGAKVRLRPSYFPFVEPGAEVDVYLKGFGWLEVLGAGMVHPHLFEVAGFKGENLSGFAFGIGIERITMLLHRIQNIRHFYGGDLRFLRQFP